MTAGLDHAKGDFLVFMDADLQHPPELISEMLKSRRRAIRWCPWYAPRILPQAL